MSKKKRNKRLFPRHFASDFINTYAGLDQSKIAAYDLYNNRARVRSTKGGRNTAEPVLNNTFTQEIPHTMSEQRYRGSIVPVTNEYLQDGKKHTIIKHEEGRFPEDIEAANPKMWMPTPRAEALKKAALKTKTLYRIFQSNRLQKVVEYRTIVLLNLPTLSLRLHFAGLEFVFEQTSEKYRSVSKTYSSRDEAMLAYHRSSISWSILERLS